MRTYQLTTTANGRTTTKNVRAHDSLDALLRALAPDFAAAKGKAGKAPKRGKRA